MAFADDMRNVATSLINQFGSNCVLTHVDKGNYDPLTGTASEVRIDYPMKYAQSSKFNNVFQMDGTSTGLDSFQTESMVVAWFGHELSTSHWEFDGMPINNVSETKTQDKIVIYNLTVGIKK